jgi:hypothetical protein
LGGGERLKKLLSLGLLAWFSVAGWAGACWPREGSYEAQSPTTGRMTLFDDEEIECEIQRIIEESHGSRFSAIQSVAEMSKLFVSPDRLIGRDAQALTMRYNQSKALGVPVAAVLDDVPARYADAVEVIERETQNARAFVQKSRGN